MKKMILIGMILFSPLCNACTGFGAITKTGTILGKNRDYFYGPQKVGVVKPVDSLLHWYGNTYQHANKFFALMSTDGVSMGVNDHGLAAIEQDSLLPTTSGLENYKQVQQLKTGTPDGTVLYGVLQNFNSINEMIPYLSKIFGNAAPDFYQMADNKKILTVEVGFGTDKQTHLHPFTYQILSHKNAYFAHTNTFLSPKFSAFNQMKLNPDSLASAQNRLKTITQLILNTKDRNIENASRWFMNTYSNVGKNDECLNTSIFRTDTQGVYDIDTSVPSKKIYGTTSSIIFENNGNLNNSEIYILIVNSIRTHKYDKQIIQYKTLQTSFANLFLENKLNFTKHTLLRTLPVNGICH